MPSRVWCGDGFLAEQFDRHIRSFGELPHVLLVFPIQVRWICAVGTGFPCVHRARLTGELHRRTPGPPILPSGIHRSIWIVSSCCETHRGPSDISPALTRPARDDQYHVGQQLGSGVERGWFAWKGRSPACSPSVDRPHGSLDGLSSDDCCDRLEQPANAAPRRLPIVHLVDDQPKHRGLSII
jgi:hypothetical protein